VHNATTTRGDKNNENTKDINEVKKRTTQSENHYTTKITQNHELNVRVCWSTNSCEKLQH